MLALVAGTGRLPELVAAAAAPDVIICALQDQLPDHVTAELTFRLETLGTFLLELGARGVTEVCFCGAIKRPTIDPGALDDETKPLVPLLQDALGKGDDGALRVVISLFEQTGFTVRGAHDLTPSVLMQAGTPTARQPRDGHKLDADAAQKILALMGEKDLGQACIMRKEQLVIHETITGTDAMLAELSDPVPNPPAEMWQGGSADLTADARAWIAEVIADAHDAPGAGGILVKGPKPGQERRADLRAIGLQTAIGAIRAGLDGIVIEADGVIVLDAARVLTLLDAADLILWSRTA